METASSAQEELQRIEQQIEQLQGAAANNQDALKQLEGLQERVEALRRQISGQLTPWERTEMDCVD
jgi:acetyl-CoA carboxylase alpha subunit